jgi:hypothetical protein
MDLVGLNAAEPDYVSLCIKELNDTPFERI